MPRQVPPANTRRRACLPCQRSKRRCDKKVPSCDLCLRKETECSYPSRNLRKGNSLKDRGEQYGRPLPVQPGPSESNASAIYFIAPCIFIQARLGLPRLEIPIPIEVTSLIGETASIHKLASTFFQTVHTWMPIVSKKVFFAHLLNPLAQRQTELSLLAVCMLLCSTSHIDQDRGRNGRTSLYQIVKRYYFEVEATGTFSIHILQAAVLIAVYEICQAIYPAAYLTVGACARYGCVLGIEKLGLDLMGESLGPLSWVEIEERRRVWWAILLLDRFTNASNPERCLVTEDPTFDTYLPVDDDAWDNGTTKPGDAVNISAGFNLRMGIFSRVAQATYLLSQALISISSIGSGQESTAFIDETEQLRRTLLALVNLVDTEATVRRLEFCTASAICFSTILLLQEHHWRIHDVCGIEDENESLAEAPWDETRTAVERLSNAAVSYDVDYHDKSVFSERVSFFLLHAVYQAGSVLIRTGCGNSDKKEVEASVKIIRKLLRSINKKWCLSGVYLTILEAKEITAASDHI